jgi:hypothetical protein
MSFSIHLFKLAKINSEIKYVANSIVRDAPTSPGYAFPTISNIHEWQVDVMQKLDQWASEIPSGGDQEEHIRLTCQIRYHSLRMLLLRPSPAIPMPSTESLKVCYDSACRSIHIYEQLYKNDLLVYSWMTFHGLILSTVTMVYCIRAVPAIARTIELEALMGDFGATLSILSATGEYWPGAKRSRDVLHDLSRTTVRWIQDSRAAGTTTSVHHFSSQEPLGTTDANDGLAVHHPLQPEPWTSAPPVPVEIPLLDEMWSFPFAPFEISGFANAGDAVIHRLFEDLISQPI